MKDFLKNFPFFEPPFGEVTIVIAGITALLIFGLISFNEALSWLGVGAFLGGLYLTIFFCIALVGTVEK
jgi:hypothetical protein